MEYTMDWETYELLYKRYLDPSKIDRLLSFANVEGKVVLDICAGHCRLSQRVEELGAKRIFAVDLNPNVTNYLTEKITPVNSDIDDFCSMHSKHNLYPRPGIFSPIPKVDVAFCQQGVNYWFRNDGLLNELDGVVSEDFTLVFNTFNTPPPEVPTSLDYEIDGVKYKEVFYLSDGGTRVHHVQMCQHLAPHVTSFNWVPISNFKIVLGRYFGEVTEHVFGKTSIFVAKKYKTKLERDRTWLEEQRKVSEQKDTKDTKDAKDAWEPKQVMPRVKGKPFRCECGANVFTEYEPLKYECNACRAAYAGEKAGNS